MAGGLGFDTSVSVEHTGCIIVENLQPWSGDDHKEGMCFSGWLNKSQLGLGTLKEALHG